MRFAYADPPYPGVAHRYPEKTEVDHAELISRLQSDYPDGWALSTSSPALRTLLPMCPEKVRVAAWTKRYAKALPGIRPVYAWEPVIFWGGRDLPEMTMDWHLADPSVGRFSPGYVLGKKPDSFSFWVFRLLGAQPGDEMDDLYPGTGAVGRAWDAYRRQLLLPSVTDYRPTHLTSAPLDL